MLDGMLFDAGPRLCVGYPGLRSSLFRRQRGWLVVFGNAARINFADLYGLAVRGGVDGLRAICEGDDDAPGFGESVCIAPDEGRRDDVWREYRTVLRIIDRDGCAVGGRWMRSVARK